MNVRRHLFPVVAATALLAAACGDDSDAQASDPASVTTTTTAASTGETPPTTVATSATEPRFPDALRNYRYCEVIALGADDDGDGMVEAEVWNTMPLNECPQEAFDSIDLERAASDLDATVAVPNGPRYWVLDSIEARSAGPGTIHDFGGIAMRLAATVTVDPADRKPYRETSVARDTVFGFSAGREVPVLTAPDGSWYVMQSYSLEVDPELTIDQLPDIGPRLELPDGWTFSSRTLDEDLDVLSVGGSATVIQDDLQNTYQLAGRVPSTPG